MKDLTQNKEYDQIQSAIALWDAKTDANYFIGLENAAASLVGMATPQVRRKWADMLGLNDEMFDAERVSHIAATLVDRAKERRLDGTDAWQLVVSGYVAAMAKKDGGR